MAGSNAPGHGQPGPIALVLVPLPSSGRLDEAVAAGLVPYMQIERLHGSYLLAGRRTGVQPAFPVQVLDADTSGAAYYLVYPAPGAALPRWADHGRLLLDDGVRVLLRTTPDEAERLAEAGADLVRITLEPMALAPAAPVPEEAPAAITPDPAIQGMIDQVSTTAVYDYTAQLSGEAPVTVGGQPYTILTRHTNSGTPIQKATQFVGEHLAARGYTVEYQQWSGASNPNVIGQRTGQTNPGDIFLIGGHLDDMPSSGSAPGADDNASGSVGALVMADIASQYTWGCTLRFAFWTGEEQGLLGSNAYAARAKSQGENIRGYLNLDMISYNSAAPRELNLFAKSSIPGSENIADLFVDVVSAYGLDLAPVKYVNDTLGDRSDNASFWKQSYPAILAIEDYYGDFNPDYHTINDRLARADLGYSTEFVKAAVGTFAHMAGCLIPSTPTATPTATPTPSATATHTPTPTATHTPTATATAASTIHTGDLDGSRQWVTGGSWRAGITITVHDGNHSPVQGAAVAGAWSGGYAGSASCTTNNSGQCSVSTGSIAKKKSDVAFSVSSVSKAGYTYRSSGNHDPDGDSNGTSITVKRPAAAYLPLVSVLASR